ncbi:hypothetical protein [Streptomyces sp. CMB-StM0423]|uniref:hypothetical protein n=1 Tax=Streptomyces sp. CMB-StM0423 TaxID=2059884 RepID=UPI00131AC993|nr:hypothetical protein [Streptomyces sp. CMB-StM0423]
MLEIAGACGDRTAVVIWERGRVGLAEDGRGDGDSALPVRRIELQLQAAEAESVLSDE